MLKAGTVGCVCRQRIVAFLCLGCSPDAKECQAPGCNPPTVYCLQKLTFMSCLSASTRCIFPFLQCLQETHSLKFRKLRTQSNGDKNAPGRHEDAIVNRKPEYRIKNS